MNRAELAMDAAPGAQSKLRSSSTGNCAALFANNASCAQRVLIGILGDPVPGGTRADAYREHPLYLVAWFERAYRLIHGQ